MVGLLYAARNLHSKKLTTRRENILPIFDFVQLINVSRVICEGIELFSKKGDTQEKKDWTIPNARFGGLKRKHE